MNENTVCRPSVRDVYIFTWTTCIQSYMCTCTTVWTFLKQPYSGDVFSMVCIFVLCHGVHAKAFHIKPILSAQLRDRRKSDPCHTLCHSLAVPQQEERQYSLGYWLAQVLYILRGPRAKDYGLGIDASGLGCHSNPALILPP